jgi:hypothetical protein
MPDAAASQAWKFSAAPHAVAATKPTAQPASLQAPATGNCAVALPSQS